MTKIIKNHSKYIMQSTETEEMYVKQDHFFTYMNYSQNASVCILLNPQIHKCIIFENITSNILHSVIRCIGHSSCITKIQYITLMKPPFNVKYILTAHVHSVNKEQQ